MSFSAIFARLVATIGGGMILLRRWHGPQQQPVYGASPSIPEAVPQNIPTLKMPTARGWRDDEKPVAAPGLKVNAFARDLRHPRQVYVLPNGDVLASEALSLPGPVRSAFDYAILSTMRRAAATGNSPNRIMLLRDTDADGVADVIEPFLVNLNQPYGMALKGETLYVGNTDAVLAFPYTSGETRITATPRKIVETRTGGHWTRNLLLSADGDRLYVAVGSDSNIAEKGLDIEEGRACIYEIDLATGEHRIFASGLRNPVGMAWEPGTGALWTVVNERDGLGDEVPPDYLTSVKDGAFYGWPWAYWGIVDDRVPANPEMAAKAIAPDYALGGHTASLGLCWVPAGTLPGFGDGMAIGQHGSWNRSTLSGYKLVFVPFEGGRPSGQPRDILTGFLGPDEKFSYGRPVGVCIGPDGKSLLLADDVGDVIWRVTGE
ncbi:MAG TPA: sorbosone dehydrogenase family protein [Devosiaceae bacterium]|jgi:glucose/arabinose dehydrogenase|nr:sorbosone dehydrogenase family protein [Devosiaceae bacterium]